uniref:Uncharacterized protein n=1 Tax=Tanacetum cinerariifolium TaxID=118510 RepID=A0A699J8L6_TANCI|nr:hypothetical protein [Tanacetum cinerariifolium]
MEWITAIVRFVGYMDLCFETDYCDSKLKLSVNSRFGTLDKPVVHMFLHYNSRPNSPPRPRTTFSDYASDPPSQNRRGAKEAHRTSTTGVPSNLRKASSTFNFFDDLRQFLVFQEVEGDPEERRRARLEREQRTQERAVCDSGIFFHPFNPIMHVII